MKTYTIILNALDVGQLLDGLEIRAEAWEKTAAFLRTRKLPSNEFFVIEECNDPEEAEQIAEQYRLIIRKIRNQMESQKAKFRSVDHR